jgi:hypothetical protein
MSLVAGRKPSTVFLVHNTQDPSVRAKTPCQNNLMSTRRVKAYLGIPDAPVLDSSVKILVGGWLRVAAKSWTPSSRCTFLESAPSDVETERMKDYDKIWAFTGCSEPRIDV